MAIPMFRRSPNGRSPVRVVLDRQTSTTLIIYPLIRHLRTTICLLTTLDKRHPKKKEKRGKEESNNDHHTLYYVWLYLVSNLPSGLVTWKTQVRSKSPFNFYQTEHLYSNQTAWPAENSSNKNNIFSFCSLSYKLPQNGASPPLNWEISRKVSNHRMHLCFTVCIKLTALKDVLRPVKMTTWIRHTKQKPSWQANNSLSSPG